MAKKTRKLVNGGAGRAAPKASSSRARAQVKTVKATASEKSTATPRKAKVKSKPKAGAAAEAKAAKLPKAKALPSQRKGKLAAAVNVAKKAVSKVTGKLMDKQNGIVEGSRAPSFELLDDSGATHTAQSLAGKPYVLYFYPKDDTPGCTKEACDFRDSLTRFNSSRIRVIGVSPDSTATHGKFRKKYGLTFPLLADPDKELAHAYGVWVKKQNYGREYMGIERSTFLIGADGIVRKIWRRVRVPGHVEDVLSAAQSL